VGAAALAVAPFFIDLDQGKILAIFGLFCLTFQALSLKAFNLVAINIISIWGYLYAL
jgi:hypothetical protein